MEGELRTKAVNIGGRPCQLSSDDTYLDAIGGNFEPEMVSLFEKLIKKEDFVVDVGANIGCTAILFSGLAARVVAIEASPTTYKILKVNLEQNRCANVQCVNRALGASPGVLELTRSSDNRAGGFISNKVKPGAGHTTETVEIARLDDLSQLRDENVDFIKIDVEGFEKNVIEGGRRTISESKPLVVLELNHWCLNAFQRISIPDFFDFLRATFPILIAVDGFELKNLHDNDQSYYVMHEHIVKMRFLNVIGAFTQQQIHRLPPMASI